MSAQAADRMSRNESGEQRTRRQRAKNRALMLTLLAFVVLVYIISIVRMGGG
jgi:hypothetical protein